MTETRDHSVLEPILVGTAQLTSNYGIYGKDVDETEAETRLASFRRLGFSAFDTAPAYGSAEIVLGRGLSVSDYVITKTEAFDAQADAGTVRRAISDGLTGSLRRLNRQTVDGLLLHTPDALTDTVVKTLETEREAGRARKIGVSIYTASHIDDALDRFDPGIIQLPLSLVDQRLIRSGHIDKLIQRGVEVHVRSVFLQGILLAEPTSLPPHVKGLGPVLELLDKEAGNNSIQRVGICLGHVLKEVPGARIVVGLQDQSHATMLCDAMTNSKPPSDSGQYAIDDPQIVNPALWPR